MAFWGACVASTEPYTLALDVDHKRLRISQATLEHRKDRFVTKAWSILQCAVGSKPPVSVCSLSKDFPFCPLDLELEESEQVVFTVKGPQLIHLSGYYVHPRAVDRRAASTNTYDPIIDCHEDKVVLPNEEDRKLTAEEGDTGDRFLNGGQDNIRENGPRVDNDLLVDADMHEEVMWLNGGQDNIRENGPRVDNDLLVDADMHEEADEEMVKEQLEFLYACDTVQDSEDEEYVPRIRKSAATAKKMKQRG